MHIIIYMLLSLNWERGHIIAILRKGGGRKRFWGLLSFFDGFLLRFLFFCGLAGFCGAWLEGTGYLLSKDSAPLLFPEFLATASTHLVTQTAVPELNSFHRKGTREFFGIRSSRPLTVTSILKTKFFIPISSDEKGTTSGAEASANHLAPSSSSPSPVVLFNDLHSLLRPTKLGLWSADSLTYIRTGFVTSFNNLTTRNSPSFIFLF